MVFEVYKLGLIFFESGVLNVVYLYVIDNRILWFGGKCYV